jgi:hypothetical protein
MIMVVNQQGEIIFTCLDCSLKEVKTKLERFVRKRKELMVILAVVNYLAMTV